MPDNFWSCIGEDVIKPKKHGHQGQSQGHVQISVCRSDQWFGYQEMPVLFGSPPNGSNSRHKTADVMDEDEKKSPVKSQNDGKNAFFPTMGCKMERRVPMIDSTMICPFPGTNLGFPTVKRIKTNYKNRNHPTCHHGIGDGKPKIKPKIYFFGFFVDVARCE